MTPTFCALSVSPRTSPLRQVLSLYSDAVVSKCSYRCQLQAVALDPRYSGRKAKEVVVAADAGSLVLSSQVGLLRGVGWVGLVDG